MGLKYKKGDTYKALVPFCRGFDPYKVHITNVFPSDLYDADIIIYKVYGKHKKNGSNLCATIVR